MQATFKFFPHNDPQGNDEGRRNELANELKKSLDSMRTINKLFEEGKSPFFERPNPLSDITPEEVQQDMTGTYVIFPII